MCVQYTIAVVVLVCFECVYLDSMWQFYAEQAFQVVAWQKFPNGQEWGHLQE